MPAEVEPPVEVDALEVEPGLPVEPVPVEAVVELVPVELVPVELVPVELELTLPVLVELVPLVDPFDPVEVEETLEPVDDTLLECVPLEVVAAEAVEPVTEVDALEEAPVDDELAWPELPQPESKIAAHDSHQPEFATRITPPQ